MLDISSSISLCVDHANVSIVNGIRKNLPKYGIFLNIEGAISVINANTKCLVNQDDLTAIHISCQTAVCNSGSLSMSEQTFSR
jgi:hypothetical protein